MPPSTDTVDSLPVNEFARWSSLSISTIRRRIRDGSLPAWQPGGPGTRLLIPVTCLPSFQVAATIVPQQKPAVNHRTPKATKRLPGSGARWRRGR